MELIIKKFSELTIDELWEIYKLRADVFIVEQECPYQDIDEFDKVSYHLYMRDDSGIYAYLRVLPAETVYDSVSIGRVISMKRRQGIGTQLVKEGMKIACKKFGAEEIMISAQVYVKEMYEKLGFVQISDEFLEIGIAHIKMKWKKEVQ